MTNLNRCTVSFYTDYILSKWYKQYFEIVLKKSDHACITFAGYLIIDIYIYCLNILEHMRIVTSWTVHVVFPIRMKQWRISSLLKNISLSLLPSSSAWSRPSTSFRASGVTEHFNNLCTNSSTSYATFEAHPSTSLNSTCWRGYLLYSCFPRISRKPITFKHLKGHVQLLSNDCWRTPVDGGW